ncbi:hypothetical protein G6011_02724 [Alternaria panax]|uniref:HET-domain-containing protein n=1 Tax=Alternaria panax TaxID=48097 RepID=A0AAD4FC98_9PLEO|nr:hypothetical protein G6011_02724 [Alternaria panax]
MDESQVPPYAILSHTWGPDEVTLQHFTEESQGHNDNSLKSSRGYWKIIKACQQALQDGFHYVWVDTCCIEKTSSAELSEAINSMFRWYKNAEICYAYLDDVNVGPEVGNPDLLLLDYKNFSEDELASSRWFTRGWTLQELVAPSEVFFYGKEWRYIDGKTSLSRILQRITGIGASVLLGYQSIGDQSIAERMSWMARRTTTRTEDMAYSLMGIFDVNMPLLYGEGGKAFVRLQEEIMKDSVDHSIFAWNACRQSTLPLETLTSIFASHPNQFSGSGGIYSRKLYAKDGLEEDFPCTNRGIRIKLRIRPYEHLWYGTTYGGGFYLAVLECGVSQEGPQDAWAGIILRRLSGSTSQYVRVSGPAIVPVVFGEVSEAQKQRGVVCFDEADVGKTIYLCKKLPETISIRDYCGLLQNDMDIN